VVTFRFEFRTADTRPRSRGTTCPRLAPRVRCIRAIVRSNVARSSHVTDAVRQSRRLGIIGSVIGLLLIIVVLAMISANALS
jgi:hypothetical protein